MRVDGFAIFALKLRRNGFWEKLYTDGSGTSVMPSVFSVSKTAVDWQLFDRVCLAKFGREKGASLEFLIGRDQRNNPIA
ncbi:MAG: hypothetical protein SynsKO_35910 [Synoicihabitans sp.]